MANELTEHNGIPKPNPTNEVADDVIKLQEAFDIIDLLIYALQQSLAGKAASDHNHSMEAITGLIDALSGKMAASKTFALVDLTDVAGADEALNNYILTKIDGLYVFRSGLSVLGEHGHAMADITGLVDALASITDALADKVDPAALAAALAPKASAADPELTGDIYLHGRQRGPATAVGAANLDCSATNYFTKTVAGSTTFTVSNIPAGAFGFALRMTYNGGAVTWPAAFKWTAPTLTSGKTYLIICETDHGGAKIRATAIEFDT